MHRVTINSRELRLDGKPSVLDALREAGVSLPTLCHDDRLKPIGSCRLCLVAVRGFARPIPACATPLIDGMVIDTDTAELVEGRRMSLLWLSNKYPRSAYDAFPNKEFHRYVAAFGLEGELRGSQNPDCVDDSHPYIHVDMSRCVYCYRCVRICDEVQGQFVWHVRNRGEATRICPDGPSLMASSCVSCGACVDTCPTGALEDRTVLERGEPTRWTKTTCPYCGTGCELSVGTEDQSIIAVRPAIDAPVNKGHLCSKGRYAFAFVSSPERISTPMVRDGGQWKTVSWNEALSFTADRLGALVRRYGPDSVAVLGSARGTNEDNYLAQKFARLVLGTNNVDCCARVCHTPSATALKRMLGTGASTSSFDDLELARTLFVYGANPTENHPIVGARLKQAARRGAKLIVIDPRRIELARYATWHLAPRPGTDIPLLNAIAHTILTEGLVDQEFLADRVDGVGEFTRSVAEWPAERAAAIAGVSADAIREVARLYATDKPAISFHGLGLTEHVQGTAGVMCVVNLALLTGNIGRPGSGVNPLRGQNNVQGAAIMGCDPSTLTGGLSFPSGRDRVERIWQAKLPSTHGLNLLRMMDAAAEGRLKGLWAIGYDVLLTNANAAATSRAFDAMELVIVQDMFLNETAERYGTVFFPACSSFEKDGTFMNAERRVQRVRKVLEPTGESKSDWQIIGGLARAMGVESLAGESPEAIWNEIRTVWEDVGGISYRRLETQGLQWPCRSDDDPGTTTLHGDTFRDARRAQLRVIDYHPTAETVTPEFPLLLTTGRTLHQFNAGTMTGRTRHEMLRPSDVLDMSPVDAEARSLRTGERARLVSRYGEVVLPVNVNPAMKPGELFASFQSPSVFLNRITSPYRDEDVDTPEYKVTAVRVEPA